MPRAKKHTPLIDDYHLLSYDVLDSTNEEAKRLAEGGASGGAVIWAKRQTHGKGRMGRDWVSDDGNLYLSFLLCPEYGLEKASQLPFITAVAAWQAISAVLDDITRLSCKWPNDLLIDGKKVGGILLESFKCWSDQGDGSKERQWVIIGMGVNIDNFPEDTMYPATCLKACGVELVSAKIILTRFIHHFINLYDDWNKNGFEKVFIAWNKLAHGQGEQITVEMSQESKTGVLQGINETGQLILAQDDGTTEFINAGDVFFTPEDA
jgi:BirA family biotin operon repressor/biotin-[acetyl-CoA-carboxylase] ligase